MVDETWFISDVCFSAFQSSASKPSCVYLFASASLFRCAYSAMILPVSHALCGP